MQWRRPSPRRWAALGACFVLATFDCSPRRASHVPRANGSAEEGAAADQDRSSADADRTRREAGISVRLVMYYLAQQPCPDRPEVPLPTCGGAPLATVSKAFHRAITMQGSGHLCDGRVVGVRKVSPLCFAPSGADAPWGRTASGRPAAPFLSISVDRRRIRMGSWYYVPELRGLALPAPAAGRTHDGCVRADDTGQGISDEHIDFFVGTKEAAKALEARLAHRAITLLDGAGRCGP